jgi:hypothetical protein
MLCKVTSANHAILYEITSAKHGVLYEVKSAKHAILYEVTSAKQWIGGQMGRLLEEKKNGPALLLY